MTCAAGCGGRQVTVTSECDWVQPIVFTTAEADAVIDAAPDVAMQIVVHNDQWQEFCG